MTARGDVVAEFMDRPDSISAMADEIARLRGEKGRNGWTCMDCGRTMSTREITEHTCSRLDAAMREGEG